MNTQPKIYRQNNLVSSVTISEATISLIECYPTRLGLLISKGISSDSITPGTMLLDTLYLLLDGKTWRSCIFSIIRIEYYNGTWYSIVSNSNKILHEPSLVPYNIIIISEKDYINIINNIKIENVRMVFDFAKYRFGKLPEFSIDEDHIVTPDNYATAGDNKKDYDYFEFIDDAM